MERFIRRYEGASQVAKGLEDDPDSDVETMSKKVLKILTSVAGGLLGTEKSGEIF